MKIQKLLPALTILLAFGITSCSPDKETKNYLVTFEDVTLGAEGYWNGSDGSGKFTSEGFNFTNTFTDWGGGVTSWDGFACSAKTDTQTPGFQNEFSAIAGKGANDSKQYAVGFKPFTSDLTINFPKNEYGYYKINSLSVTNSTYVYLAIKNGEGSAKKFGENDWYKITIKGYKGEAETGSIDYYLADFREGKTFISDQWVKVDVSNLGEVDKLVFSFESTDIGEYGMNTPAYVCIDNIELSQEIEK